MSLIQSKFEYTPLTRSSINGKRKYNTPDGLKLPSVTTILDATKDKSHLNEWKKRVGHKKAQEIVTEAASVGTRMHNYLEKYVETGEWPTAGSNPYAQKANMMAEMIKESALSDVDEIWGSEVGLYYPSIYAGTTDLVGVYKGNESIMDFKQSNRPKKEEWIEDYKLQIALYGEAHNELYGTNIQEGHVFMCSRDLTYQQFDVWPDEWKFWTNKAWDRVYEYYANIEVHDK